MDAEQLARIEQKLDLLLEKVEKLEPARRTPRGRRPRRPLAHDPEVERRFRERVDWLRRTGRFDELDRLHERSQTEHSDDPDWWLREMLDRADRDDPIG